jgi:hypothetical protein
MNFRFFTSASVLQLLISNCWMEYRFNLETLIKLIINNIWVYMNNIEWKSSQKFRVTLNENGVSWTSFRCNYLKIYKEINHVRIFIIIIRRVTVMTPLVIHCKFYKNEGRSCRLGIFFGIYIFWYTHPV